MNNLRIAYLAQQSGIRLDDFGGGAVHIRAILKNLNILGHRVRFITFNGSRNVEYVDDLYSREDASLTYTNNRTFKIIESGLRRLQRELHLPYLAIFDSLRYSDACIHNLSGFDVIHERFSMMGIGGTMTAQKLGIPLILEVNADFIDELDNAHQELNGITRLSVKLASRICFAGATRIITVSNQLKNHLIDNWGLKAEKISVIPNGAEIDCFNPSANPLDARAKLSLPEQPIILYVGKFWPWHAIFQMVDIFNLVHKQISNVHLYFVGDGPTRLQAEAYVRELDLNQNITFIGAIPNEKIPGYLAACDIAVAPFLKYSQGNGGSPLKLFEYMAAGKAIVATATGQVPEIIRHGENGLLVPPDDVHGFSSAILELLANRELRDRLGKKARQDVERKYTWRQYAEKLVTIYMTAISGEPLLANSGE